MSTTSREVRPTVSARRLRLLVEQVTDRYAPLPQFSQRTRFLINVQLPLLESYHARISSSLDAHESLSSALVRAVPGALGGAAGDHRDRGRLTSGVEGVTRLCKALVSAKWISMAMKGWGEDLVGSLGYTSLHYRLTAWFPCAVFPGTMDRNQSSRFTPCSCRDPSFLARSQGGLGRCTGRDNLRRVGASVREARHPCRRYHHTASLR